MQRMPRQTPKRPYRGAAAAERVADRKRRLLDAAYEVIGDEGYANTTVRKVCEAAGLTQRYYYEAFKGAEDMFAQVYEEQLDHIEQELTSVIGRHRTLPDKIDAAVLAYLELLQRDRRLARITLIDIYRSERSLDEVYTRGTGRFSRWLMAVDRAAMLSSLGDGLDLAVVADAAIGATITVAQRLVLNDFDRDVEQVARSLGFAMRAVLSGVVDHTRTTKD